MREDIIYSYIQNTNSIINNSNMKTSLSPINNYAKTPFAKKKLRIKHWPLLKEKIFRVLLKIPATKKNFPLDNLFHE